MKSRAVDAELATFVCDQLRTELGRRELRAFLRDVVDLMLDQHDVQVIARALKYSGVDVVAKAHRLAPQMAVQRFCRVRACIRYRQGPPRYGRPALPALARFQEQAPVAAPTARRAAYRQHQSKPETPPSRTIFPHLWADRCAHPSSLLPYLISAT